MSVTLACVVRARLFSTRHSAWRLAREGDRPDAVRDVEIQLEIQGDATNGYHFVMEPEGCFAADTWHETTSEAQQEAYEAFGAPLDGWRPKSD